MPPEQGGQTRDRPSMVASLQEVIPGRSGWQVNKTLDRWICPVVAPLLRGADVPDRRLPGWEEGLVLWLWPGLPLALGDYWLSFFQG